MKKAMLLSCLLSVAFSAGVSASVYTWNPEVREGAWNDSANWLVDGAAATTVPGASDTVSFVAGEKAVIKLDANTTVGTVTGPVRMSTSYSGAFPDRFSVCVAKASERG